MSARNWVFVLAMAAAAVSMPIAAFAAATQLQPGTAYNISLQAGNLVSGYVAVDASAKQLNVDVTGTGGDVDLFLRYGSPFPDCSTTSCSYDMLLRYAQYHSMSSSSNESIVVTNASTIPLAAGNWYVVAINGANSGSNSSATATLTATPSAMVSTASINLDFANPSTNSDPTLSCDVTPWSDSTAATPVGNNPGTTLGQQRKNALQYAVQQLASQLNTPVPITVHACWAHLGGTATRATLAHASSTSLAFSDTSFPMPWLSKRYTWYTNTQIARMGGTTPCGALGGSCDGVDGDVVEITFNSDIGSASVLGGAPFYFGYTSDASSNSSDFIAIAMHEITHGLGFLGLANTDPGVGPIGARAGITSGATTVTYQNYDEGPWDDVFGDNVVNVAGNGQSYTPFFGYELNGQPNNAARATAMTSGNTVTSSSTGNRFTPTLLRWSDPLAVNSSANQATGAAPGNFPSLYAPCDLTSTAACSTSAGSTLSHTVQQGDLMNAFYNVGQSRTMGLAAPMLAAMGWSTTAAPAATFAKPFTGIWYDRAHSGHGLDFRFVGHDDLGDNYFLIFYTYDQTGAIEIFQSQGHVVDGVYVPIIIGSDGSTLVRMHYDPVAKKATPTSNTGGSIVVDFNQAANSPACRNIDRSAAILLGVMSWSFADTNGNVTEKGDWCVEPLTTLAQNASPDYGGLYYGGSSDSGWGFSVLDVNRGSYNQVALDFYFGDASGKPVWAVANTGDQPFVNGQSIPLYQNDQGYCRTCTPKSVHSVQIGTITLDFSTNPAKASINAVPQSGGSFIRSNVSLTNLGVAQQP